MGPLEQRPSVGVPGERARSSTPRRDIQGLRMLAVGSVIADHVLGWPHGGFVGVDVFFVISGFLITGVMLREADRSGQVSLTGFYRRRIKRLMPAALLVLGVTVLAAAWLLPRSRAGEVLTDAGFAAIFTVNWRLAAVGTDYFAAGQPPSPLQHYWSLSVEEQFYVVWPLVVIVLLAALGVRRGGALGVDTARRVLVGLGICIVVVIAASLVWAFHETTANPTYAYFSTLSRAWELGIGAALAVLLRVTSRRISPGWAPWLAWTGVAGIIASWFLVSQTSGFPAPGAMLPVLATALVLAAGADQPESYDRRVPLLTNRASTYVGDISYSLYLWHFPVAILLLALLPSGEFAYVAWALGLTAVLSVASYHLVEDPVRRSAWLTTRMQWDRRAVSIVAAASVVVLAGAAATTHQLTRAEESVEVGSVAGDGCVGVGYLLSDCDPDDLSGEVVPAVDALADDTGGGYACWRSQDGDLATCGHGDPNAPTRVAVVGDSHAAMLLPALLPDFVERGWYVDTYVGFGCQWRSDSAACDAVMDQTQDLLLENDYDVIVTSAARWAADTDRAKDGEAYAEQWAPLVDAGAEVVAIGDAPTAGEEALACVTRVGFDPREDDCGTPRDVALEPVDPLERAVEMTPGAAYVDVTDLYCVDGECPAAIGGVLVYRDAVGHVTATYMETLRTVLQERIDDALA